MKNTLPIWRIDNIFPLIGLIIGLVINVGTIFWWSGRMDMKLEQVIASQKEQREMWLQLEKRTGTLEISRAENISWHEEIKRILKLQ